MYRLYTLLACLTLFSCGNSKMKLKVDCSDLESAEASILVKSVKGYDTLAQFNNFVAYFEYETEVVSPRYIYVSVENQRYPLGIMQETGEFDLKMLKGGAFNYTGGKYDQKFRQLYQDEKYQKHNLHYRKEAEKLDWQTANSKEKERVYAISGKANQRIAELYDSLRYMNPIHAVLACGVSRNLGSKPAQTIKLINQLDRKVYETEIKYWNKIYKETNSLIAIQKKVSVGKKFYDFNFKDVEGKRVALKDILKENKYVLIEFWASWCGPCRKEIPYLKKDYEEYHNKGFEIISISCDKDESQWLKALKKENLQWYNVRDIDRFADKCGVKGIPANWLLDNTGVIVAKDLRGHHVEEFLQGYLK
ncbi:TlpA disulfide reductase family protein [Marinifilum sp. D714]|uniref:TlpA family protein disulfide reductase n=1 Tax=Marinifilum sp. D714 TaxID=2937523 RepID=UPI0027CC449D|nr:TlpA disulfide reductase family protein [Marinifilum sp. D714]MDQ2177169.1 TlpA family protein disulfide reductase [Marinifilum sp. D714]